VADGVSLRTNIGRRLEILEAVIANEADTGEGLGVVAAADAIGREKTQISRGLRSLEDAGLAERDPETLEFRTGARMLQLAARAGEPALLRGALPALEHLAATIGERAHLSVLFRTSVLTVATVAPPSNLQAVGWVGRTTPVHCTASGAALLADHDDDALRELVGPDPLPAAGPGAPRKLSQLSRIVDQVRREGAVVVNGGLEEDLVAVAAPIRAPGGRIMASINISGPEFRMGPQVDRALAAVREAAAGMAT
jgi:IclR family transcriptional regulator, KDG regulon repressor